MTSGSVSKRLRREVFGQEGSKGDRKYSVRLADEELAKAQRKEGKIVLDHPPCLVNTGQRAVYLKAKKEYKKRKGKKQ